jgi:hypothetical protein
VAVLGEDAFWPADGSSRSRDELKVDPSQVVMLIEISDSDILWNEPRDVQLDDLLSGKLSWRETAPHCSRPSAFDEPLMGRNVVFADGSVYFIPDGTTTDQLRRLFSITEPFDVQKEIVDFSRRPIVFRYVVFYVWLVTLFVQFVYIFFPARRKINMDELDERDDGVDG